VTEVLYGFGTAERQRVAALRAEGRFFWLDVSLGETSRDDLAEQLGLPVQALREPTGSDSGRSSRTVYADGSAVAFALRCYVEATESSHLRPVLVHVVVTGEELLTLHQEPVSLPALLAPDLPPERGRGYAVYSVLDAMIASSFDALEEVELTLDALAATWTGGDEAPVPRATLREAGARLATMRRWVTAEQSVVERVCVEIGELHQFDEADAPSLERLDQHVDRLLASIDAAANGMAMLLDLQLNQRAYLVSVVATIFVPLTFVTGYFGMNFGWMVDRIDNQVAFWLLGVLVPIVTALLAWQLLVRRFVMGDARR
jgi:magnesium transporter